jgi:alcohol dehydrogenase class IV
MTCAHAYVPEDGGERAFSIDASSITFGRGAFSEVGERARESGCRRVALFTDRTVSRLAHVDVAQRSLRDAGVDVVVYDEVRVEPTDSSFLAAARFAKEGRFDGYVSVGGGSVIDTCKAAILYATYPADFLTYVNRPVGAGAAVPGELPFHAACPTTSGTGSELTGIAVCDVVSLHAKTGIASRRLRPTLAIVDPDATTTLPASVVAASGFDVLCHALESYTARPFTARPRPGKPQDRPMSQGRNPWSDVGSLEALRLGGQYLVRAVCDAEDAEAREKLMWAATLAGVAFGNAGVHVPHAMGYAVAGLVRSFRMPDYPPEEPMVPHGVSVIVNAPATFRFTAQASPERHLEAAVCLGEDTRGASPPDAGPIVARALERLMRDAGVPTSLTALGYEDADVGALVAGTIVQKRLLDNAPRSVGEPELDALFRDALGGRS